VATVSVNAAKQNIDHNYQSAAGQSGINAGSDGFDIQVKGNTDLKGAALTSSADKSKNNFSTGTLTFSDLENKQDTSASSYSLSVGNSTSALSQVGTNLMSNLAGQAGLPENGSERSSTQSVISPANITLTGTGDAAKDAQSQTNANTLTTRDASKANQSLKNTLTLQDAAKVQADLKTAQQNQQAGQMVGSVTFNVVGDIAKANGWEDSSPQKIALHAIAGYVVARVAGQGGATGAVAAAANEALTKKVNETIDAALPIPNNATPEQAKQILEERKALSESAATLIGIGAVAMTGGNTQQKATGGMVTLTADQFNRQLHPDERKWAKDNAGKYQKYLEGKTGEKISTEEAYQRLLSAGYAVVDSAAQNTGKSDETAKQFIGVNSPSKLFSATASERNSPLLGGNPDGSYTPEQQARWGTQNPSALAQARVQAAQTYVNTTCDSVTCSASKVEKIASAVAALEQEKTLYQDDAAHTAKIVNQQNQLLSSLSPKDILGAKLQAADESLMLDVLMLPSLPGAAVSVARTSLLGKLVSRGEMVGVNGGTGNAIVADAAGGAKNPLLADAMPRNGDRLVLNQGNVPTCGANSCGMALDTMGKPVDVATLIQKIPPTAEGIYSTDVAVLMKSQGVDATAFGGRNVTDLARYTENGTPVVVRIADPGVSDFSHFVVVDGVTVRNGVSVVAIRDSQNGTQYFSPVTTFNKSFTGEVIVPKPATTPVPPRK